MADVYISEYSSWDKTIEMEVDGVLLFVDYDDVDHDYVDRMLVKIKEVLEAADLTVD